MSVTYHLHSLSLVTDFGLEFLKTGKIMKRSNHINWVLIEKVSCPNDADDFRHTFCRTVIYKMHFEAFVQKIRVVLGS